MDKGEMLNAIKAHFNLKTNKAFADFLGISSQAISNWYSRNTFDAELIYTKCVGVNPAWLLTGEGSMLRNDERTESLPIASKTENPNEGIPLIPIHAMAGAFTGEAQVLECDCERYVVPAFKGADFLIPVKGVSMHPRFSSGDIVACKRLNMNNIFFQWNKVYVLDTDQGALIKRLKPGSDKDHVLVVSDNASFDPFELDVHNIYNVALVIGVIRLE